MDYLGWMGWAFALGAMGMASTALGQLMALRQQVEALTAELRRRGVLEPAGGSMIIVPESLRSR